MSSQGGQLHSPPKQIPSDPLNGEVEHNDDEEYLLLAADHKKESQLQVQEQMAMTDQSASGVAEQQSVKNIENLNSYIDNSENLSESIAKEESSSPLSNIQLVNSSPLTSVEDLHDNSKDTFSDSRRKESDEEDNVEYFENQISVVNSPSLNSRPISYMKKTSSANSEDGNGANASSKVSDDQQSIPSDFKMNVGSESAGVSPLDTEERVRLPGRKRPLPLSQINSKDRAGRTVIFKYASNGDYTITESLLKAGASLRVVDNAGWTPLHEACLNGHERIVELLLSYDADVDAPGGDGDRPLHDAIGNGHFGVVVLLLKHGASLDLHNEYHQTPEEFAVEKLESLVEEGDESLETDRKTAKRIVDALKEWGYMTKEVVKRNEDGQTIFHLACTAGDTQKVQKMLNYGADINAADNNGWTPIHNAALHGRVEVLQILLRYGSEVDPLGFLDETPLHDAVANGHTACVTLLLKYGAEPFRKNRDGLTPTDLVPKGRDDLFELLNMPLDYWQPYKSAEYYPRLLESASRKKSAKELSVDNMGIPKTVKREIPQHWEVLEARGSFESSREEKKFQALLKTISNTDNNSDGSKSALASTTMAITDDRGKGPGRQPHSSMESSKSATVVDKSDSSLLKAESKKKRHILSEPPPSKRSKIMSSTSPKEKSQASDVATSSASLSQVASKKEAQSLNRNDSDKTSSLSSVNPTQLPLSASSTISKKTTIDTLITLGADRPSTATVLRADVVKKPPKPRVVEKIAPPSALHIAVAALDGSSVKKKRKGFFPLSGYQAAGESSTEVSSESISQQQDGSAIASGGTPLSATKSLLPGVSATEFIPSNDSSELPNCAEAKPSSKIISLSQALIPDGKRSALSASAPGPASSSVLGVDNGNSAQPPSVKSTLPADSQKLVDVVKKTQLEKNYCLPLCAYVKQQAGAHFFKPTKISREGLWGSLPKPDHTKVFVDMQLAFCLGLKDGREFREKYPFLDSRIASSVEKAALEETILSRRLLTNMLLNISPEWITTVTVHGHNSFKISDVDIHLIFWNESLFRILVDHISKVESSQSNCPQLHWLEDMEWPAPIDAEPVEIPKIYVHKLKRMRFQ